MVFGILFVNSAYKTYVVTPHLNCLINICCDPSSEPSLRDGSDDGSQYMVSMRHKKNYLSNIIKCSSYLRLWSKQPRSRSVAHYEPSHLDIHSLQIQLQ